MTATMTHGERLATVSLETPTRVPASRVKWPALAIVGGLLLAAAAAALGTQSPTDAGPQRAVPAAPTAPFPTVSTAAVAYPPGHTSGWHVHPGLHSVVVLHGTLAVYDEACVRTEYVPGQTYLGGSAPHLARNEAAEELELAITSIYEPTSQDHGTTVAAPAGCGLR
jgi:quercetin dioxygenase-like cupin family protein